jgi:hypothetical protein
MLGNAKSLQIKMSQMIKKKRVVKIEKTGTYTHVSNKSIDRIKSPLDSLDIRLKEEGDSGR